MATTVQVVVTVTTHDGERTVIDSGPASHYGSNPIYLAQQAEDEIKSTLDDVRAVLTARYGAQR